MIKREVVFVDDLHNICTEKNNIFNIIFDLELFSELSPSDQARWSFSFTFGTKCSLHRQIDRLLHKCSNSYLICHAALFGSVCALFGKESLKKQECEIFI